VDARPSFSALVFRVSRIDEDPKRDALAMQPIAIVAVGAISPLGSGDAAFAVGDIGDAPATRVVRDARLVERGHARPIAARAPLETPAGDPARALLAGAAEMLRRELDRSLPEWRSRRLALCIGTSAGGLPTLERALLCRSRSGKLDAGVARSALYDGPLSALAGVFEAPVVQVLAACASSTVAVGLGARWLDADSADLVIAGGYDALSDFVAAGFEALGATTAFGLEPFRTKRDGMALGEGAVLVAMARAADARRPFGWIVGFSTTNDALHVTAPDPEGRGLSAAATAALDDAATEPSEIDLVSAHATATLHNDRAETRALRRVFGPEPSRAVVHPFKAVTGHCLGASGALEMLAALGAMRAGILPGARGEGPLEPDFPCRLLAENRAGETSTCLKLSAGFGGANGVLLLASKPSGRSIGARPRRAVTVLAVGEWVSDASFDAILAFRAAEEARILRLSRGGALAATAVASVLGALPPLSRARTGIVLGTSAACLEEDEKFDRARRERGMRAVEPKTFSRTSPNLPAGECAIAFGFTGAAFAVGGGPRAAVEALVVGSDLVHAGDLDHAIVVVSDEVGAVTTDLFSSAGLSVPVHGARAVVLGVDPAAAALDRAVLGEMLAARELPETGARLLARALSSAAGIEETPAVRG
jgi:3-oxoacyl-[acyl-carrier-protein] synthase-1/3-oxoacyl-[acyl-carrier-protein] synthase II